MNAKLKQSKHTVTLLILAAIALGSSSLIGCNQQPKSMFEQQAEIEAANELTVVSDDKAVPVTPATTAQSSVDNKAAVVIQTNKQQAIARQPNCDASKTVCQYFELNVLEFTPKQPWLNSIMWKTIAQVLAPETPLASQDQTAKNTILMLLKQIEYGDQAVDTLPMYERIDTELVLHPIRAVGNDLEAETTATGYLLVRSTEERDSSRQHLDYVMLDIQKKLQLTVEDILLPSASTDALLLTFKSAKNNWLLSQGVAEQYLDDWPLPLSRQWYLDEQGLHIVYQSGELLDADTDAVDLMVPYALLQGLIKPSYIVENTND